MHPSVFHPRGSVSAGFLLLLGCCLREETLQLPAFRIDRGVLLLEAVSEGLYPLGDEPALMHQRVGIATDAVLGEEPERVPAHHSVPSSPHLGMVRVVVMNDGFRRVEKFEIKFLLQPISEIDVFARGLGKEGIETADGFHGGSWNAEVRGPKRRVGRADRSWSKELRVGKPGVLQQTAEGIASKGLRKNESAQDGFGMGAFSMRPDVLLEQMWRRFDVVVEKEEQIPSSMFESPIPSGRGTTVIQTQEGQGDCRRPRIRRP